MVRITGEEEPEFSIRPIGVDDWASVRYVHASAYRILVSRDSGDLRADAFAAHVRSQDYADRLLQEHIHAAWFCGALVGTAGWVPADDGGVIARITSVFVSPLFMRASIGTRLVHNAEARARAAGFERFSTRATIGSIGFFEKLGYEVTAQGVQAAGEGHTMPVAFMRKRGSERELVLREGSREAGYTHAIAARPPITPLGR